MRRRYCLRGCHAEAAPLADTMRAVELLLDGRSAEAEGYFAEAERESRAAAERQTPRLVTISLSDTDEDDGDA